MLCACCLSPFSHSALFRPRRFRLKASHSELIGYFFLSIKLTFFYSLFRANRQLDRAQSETVGIRALRAPWG